MSVKLVAGQGMNEYALIAGLVVIGSIVTLGVLGTTVSDLLGGSITTRKTVAQSIPAQATPVVNLHIATAPSLVAPPPSASLFLDENAQSLAGAELEIKLPNGGILRATMPNFQNLPDAVGSDGVTKAYLAQLNQLIDALVQDKADPELINTLKVLAKQGFDTADSQAQSEIHFQGMRIVQEFSGKNASNQKVTVFTRQDMADSFNAMKSKLGLTAGLKSAFDRKLTAALGSKQLSDNPALAKYIEYLGGNIKNSIQRTETDLSKNLDLAKEVGAYATNYSVLGVSLSNLSIQTGCNSIAIAAGRASVNGCSVNSIADKVKSKLPNLTMTPMEKMPPSAFTEFNAQKICDQSGAIRCRAAAK